MTPVYVPLFKALKSEFEAVIECGDTNATKIHPLFDVARIGVNTTERKWYQQSQRPVEDYLDRVCNGLSKAWAGNVAMIDAYHWPADALLETGEHVLPYLYRRLESDGLRVVPVIGYERWDNQQYRLAMQGLDLADAPYYCLRLDAHAIEDAADPEFFKESVQAILDDLDLSPSQCAVLIDFGDASVLSVEEMLAGAEDVLTLLSPYGFKFFSTAGCSLPKSIDLAVKKPDSTAKVTRKEMLVWQALRQSLPNERLVYGDYGVRGPTSNEGIRNPHGNAKIRYTIDKSFFVARGHSMQLEGKGEQVWGLAKTIVTSKHFMGEAFSWGDASIAACSRKEIKGGHGQWITIDTSHHMAFVVAEVEEFELTVAMQAAKKPIDA